MKLPSSQKGFAPILIVVLLVFIAIPVFVYLGYQGIIPLSPELRNAVNAHKRATATLTECDTESNLQPMYGSKQKCKKHQDADKKFIDNWVKQGISPTEASRGVAGGGWEFFYNEDYDTAMRRFNQSWLLKNDQWDAFWGFAAILNQRGDKTGAAKMVDTAFKLNPDYPLGIYCDLGYIYGAETDINKSLPTDEFSKSVIDNLNQSGKSYARTDCYFNWSDIYFTKQNYNKSWEYIKLARLNKNYISESFLKALSEKMPEPK